MIPVGAQDPVAGPKNTVAEPSSLALLGIAALGLVLPAQANLSAITLMSKRRQLPAF